jgi:hypothetical protein
MWYAPGNIYNHLPDRTLNINRHEKQIGWDGMDWIELAQDRDQWRPLVNKVMNLRVP